MIRTRTATCLYGLARDVSNAPARAIWLLFVAALGLIAIRHAISDGFAESDPRVALFWDHAHPSALTSVVQSELRKSDGGDRRKAKSYAARLLRIDPLAPGALSLYGTVISRLGDDERAERILRVAAAHLPIDLVAHGWLYDKALTKGQWKEALRDIDILMRARPSLAQTLAPSVEALLQSGSEPITELTGLLEAKPRWRGPLLIHLATTTKHTNTIIRLYGQLQDSTAKPTDDEMRPFLQRLVREGLYDAAYSAWVLHLPPDRLAQPGLLYNERFDYPISNLPFDWTIVPASGASIEATTAGSGRGLSVEFFGARVIFANVSHMLMLSPGRYAFSGAVEAEELRTDRGLRWRIFCLDAPGSPLATTELIKDTIRRHPFRVEFSVPRDGCEAQTLLLEIPARIAAEREVSGVARYVNLAMDFLENSIDAP